MPSRSRGGAEAGLLGHALQRAEVAWLVVELVLDLDRDDRAAVRAVQAVQLRRDRLPPGADGAQVRRVVGARGRGAGQYPVGEATAPDLRVRPRADAGDEVQAVAGAEPGETAQVTVGVEADAALGLLVVDPDDVRGDGRDPARLHLQQLLLPLPGRVPGVVELPETGNQGRPPRVSQRLFTSTGSGTVGASAKGRWPRSGGPEGGGRLTRCRIRIPPGRGRGCR